MDLLESNQTLELLENYKTAKEQFEMFRFQLQKLMEEYGIKKWDSPYYTFSYVPEGTTKAIDTERLMNESVFIVNSSTGELEQMNALEYYDRFKKEQPRKAHVRIKEKQ